MPKVLLNPEENMMVSAEKLLKEFGAEKFNIRDVSKNSGVAIGTIYNYYGNKVGLATATLEYCWKTTKTKALEDCKSAKDYGEVISAIYQNVADYMSYASATMDMVVKEGKIDVFAYESKKNELLDSLASTIESGIASIGGEMCHAPCYVLALGMFEGLRKGNIPVQPLIRLASGIELLHKN